MDRQMRSQGGLEETMAAAQLGWNLMEMFHAEGDPLTPDRMDGEAEIAGRSFPWSRRILPLQQSPWYQVSIRVGTDDHLLHREVWLWPSP